MQASNGSLKTTGGVDNHVCPGADTNDTVVEVRNLRFAYPDGREALRGVDLAVRKGERVAVLGPNGAGKTTLALHLNGIRRLSEGKVRIGRTRVEDGTLAEVRRRVGVVFQDSNDQLFMPTVRDDVAFGPANLGLRGAELEERVAGALAAVNASHTAGRPPHHLSSGERRRVAVATVLAMCPDVLVLDEPAAGLDPAGRRELITTLSGLDMTLLVITHDLPLALELCGRSVIVSGGRVVADGTTAELLSDDQLLRRHRLEMPYAFGGLRAWSPGSRGDSRGDSRGVSGFPVPAQEAMPV